MIMLRVNRSFILLTLIIMLLSISFYSAEGYDNFKVAVYSRAYETEKMSDLEWLESFWNEFSRQVHVDKIYLETHRDLLIVAKWHENCCKCWVTPSTRYGG